MHPTPAPYYAVHYQPEPPVLCGTVLRPLSVAEFTESCELLLDQAQQHRCPWWLLDGRADAADRPPDVYEWLTEEFLPRVHRTLGRVPCLAFVARPEFWHALQARNYAPPAPAVLSATFRASWFITEADALAWLSQFRPVPRPVEAAGGGQL